MKAFSAALVALVALASTADAQTAPTRVRGTLDAINGDRIEFTSRSGEKATATLAPDLRVTGVSLTTLSEVKPGSYVGTAAIPQADGTLKALEIHIFPESMRGAGEGFRPWDNAPQGTMTNGTVGSVVGSDDRTITMTYKGGEKKVVIPKDVPIVNLEPGDRSLLTAGAKVIITGTRAADGAITVISMNVGKNGITPPM